MSPTLWATIAGMAVVTYLLRASFLLLPATWETPPLLKRALRYVPAAVLTAIWMPGVLPGADERLLAAAVAIVVAWRWRNTFATIVAGLLALHLFARWI